MKIIIAMDVFIHSDDHEYCKIDLPKDGKNVKSHKQGTKSLRMNDILYLDLECLLPEYDSCSNTSNKSYAENVDNHQVCGYSTTIVRNHSNEKKNYILSWKRYSF